MLIYIGTIKGSSHIDFDQRFASLKWQAYSTHRLIGLDLIGLQRLDPRLSNVSNYLNKNMNNLYRTSTLQSVRFEQRSLDKIIRKQHISYDTSNFRKFIINSHYVRINSYLPNIVVLIAN